MTARAETPKAIGMIEMRSIARGMMTADVMLKQANVDLIRAHAGRTMPASAASSGWLRFMGRS